MTSLVSSIWRGVRSAPENMSEKEVEVTKTPFKDWPNDAGFNASVEQREPTQLAVRGRIPPIVAGTLYRTGPGHYQVEDTAIGTYKLSHWFDGFTQVHRFQILPDQNDNCTVVYNSRRQVDPLIDHIRKTGSMDRISFGQKRDPCTSFFQKVKTVFETSRSHDPYLQNIGVTVSTNHSGIPSSKSAESKEFDSEMSRLVLKTDNSVYKEIDSSTLEPIGVTEQQILHPDLKGAISCAHAQYDPENRDLFNFNLEFGRVATYRIFRTSFTTGQTEILATISDKTIPAAYIHSFFLTEDFVVLAVWGGHFKAGGVKVLWEQNIIDAINPVDPESLVKWIVVDRRHGGGVIANFESPAMFSFHTVNAWQEKCPAEDGLVDICCDIIQYPTLDLLHKVYYENLVSTGPGVAKYAEEANRSRALASLVRYRLAGVPISGRPSKSNQTPKAEIILQVPSPKVGELPIINPSYSTKKSRFVYSVIDEGYSSFFDGIGKLDTETKEATYWRTPKHTPGEPIFVADPTREGEDSGFLLSVILDGEKGTSYLLCLDAKTMKETGRAECEIPVGFGFHGNHVSG